MALDDILIKLQAIRTKMTASVQSKGVSVPNNSTLYTIDKGISIIPHGSGDTSEFESEMTAIIGEDASIPPVLVSGMKFYKCASVDTTSKMWNGYELILTDGVYTVSETLTDGLSYSAVTPVVGNTYSEDALIKIDTYYMGLPVPWLDLPLDSVHCKTGQTVTSLNAAFSYDDVLNRNVLTTPGLSVSFEDTYSGDVSLTVLFRTTQSSEGYISHFIIGEGIKDGRININSGHAPFYGTFNDGSWHLLIVTYNTTDEVAYCYVDNIYQGALTESDIKAWSGSFSGFLMNNPFCIGCYSSSRDYQWYGAISSYKVYKKILDENERTAIYNDFILQKTTTSA